ncbi:uncharacterized protein LOC143287783 [Babylonia areolata]|uniref:uncharacterized protein LOC143287783 n=1 Tax=Babylonia areolata TaxID=304850 RepID=UPI003FD15792
MYEQSSASSSPKHSISNKSKSPKRREKTFSSFVDIFSNSPTHRDEAWSPEQKNRSRTPSSETHEHKSRSSVKDSSAEKSASPELLSSNGRSLSPKHGDSISELPNGKSVRRSRLSKPLLSGKDCELPRRLSLGSGSPREDDRGSSSEYDEPPVLTPEYLKSPSSGIRTPSPHVFTDKEEENFDEVDDIDRDSVFCGVPRTPGRSFHDRSPGSPSGRLSGSPRHRKDISPRSKDWEVSSSSGTSPDEELVSGQKGRGKNSNSLSALKQNNNRTAEKEKRLAPEKRRENCHKQLSTSSATKKVTKHVEPDSTTMFKDKISSSFVNDSKWRKERSDEKEYPGKVKSYNRKDFAEIKTSHGVEPKHDSASPQKHSKPPVKDEKKDNSLPAKTGDRNVFEEFSSVDVLRSDQRLKGKRRHSEEPDVDEWTKLPPKAAKLQHSLTEKENGLTPSKESPVKQAAQDRKGKDKRLADGHMLKDVKVSIQRVNSYHRCPPTKLSDPPSNNGSRTSAHHAVRPADKNGEREKREQPCSVSTRTHKQDKKDAIARERKDSSDMSLFGMEMERLGMMRLKERTRAPKEKNSHSRDSKGGLKPGPPTTATAKNCKEKSKRPEKSAATANATHGNAKISASDRSKERRPQRAAKSRSQSPDAYWSDNEAEKLRPVRKIASRRPRQSRANDEDRATVKVSEQDEARGGRPTRKRKRRRKKKKDEDEDEEEEEEEDESLEEGVTWYEEDTCASAHCCRPADRRVQWVCCDDCDSWYHTVCVNIFLEDLKDDEDYHCGCV